MRAEGRRRTRAARSRRAAARTPTKADLVATMSAAAREALADAWPAARDYAGPELRRLAEALADITRLVKAGKVNEQQARALLRIHQNTALTVLLTLEGLGIVAVENAINAALDAVGDVVNTAVGFRLL